ncbi:hypothetical protein DRE_03856 [Drechslerella stenobrocha 248]|uniref:2-dehydropantoate 2-reductase n=1 Tax=Drechslerella stenobrocha 248 TaxID=1043628 RepID=W7HTR6_9PEZI|nr:hypothetical protein DRE_03856 [Drechslerella stenobrocha 248]
MTASAVAAATQLPRIHIIGTGNVGCLVAHSLRTLRQPPPIVLIFHRQDVKTTFRRRGNRIRVERDRVASIVSGFEWQVMDALEYWMPQYLSPIRSLIVATKAHQAVPALQKIKDRLSPDSTIMLLQNGMGVLDEINRSVFPDPAKRPNVVLGINSHGAHTSRPFSVVHAGYGKIDLGVVPRTPSPPSSERSFKGATGDTTKDTPTPSSADTDSSAETTTGDVYSNNNLLNSPPDLETLPESTRELIQVLLSCYDLSFGLVSYPEILAIQLEKLAVNAVINSLTVMFNCYNGQLLYNHSISRMIRLTLFEISKVIAAMPELDNIPSREIRFSPERLERVVIGIAKRTAVNVSSMLQDVRAGKQTEVEYINGYVVNKGAELGIPCSVNFMLKEMVKGKLEMIGARLREDLPLDPSYTRAPYPDLL